MSFQHEELEEELNRLVYGISAYMMKGDNLLYPTVAIAALGHVMGAIALENNIPKEMFLNLLEAVQEDYDKGLKALC